jgi:hypothetical protein
MCRYIFATAEISLSMLDAAGDILLLNCQKLIQLKFQELLMASFLHATGRNL